MIVHGLFWNCRGLKKKGVSTFLKNLILEYKFQFIGLQETMIQDCCDSRLRKFDVNQDYPKGNLGDFSWSALRMV